MEELCKEGQGKRSSARCLFWSDTSCIRKKEEGRWSGTMEELNYARRAKS
jgi:hypothetical protein